VPIKHYDGTPITARFIAGAISEFMRARRPAQISEAAK
jgi:hypothetical protein